MITEILETERLQGGNVKLNFKRHNLIQLIKNVITDFNNQKPGIDFKPSQEELHVKIDIEWIKIVLRNIIENAIKFSKPESKPIQVSVIHEGSSILIKIKDDGPGIPEEELQNVFEPFYRTDKSRSKKTGGYGLGLALCKKIMDVHEGGIKISNNIDGGVTVVLQFTSS